jgi:transposase
MPKGVANKQYSGEFKQRVVEVMREERLSYRETAARYDVSNHHMVIRWERIYLEEGAAGLFVERRGRALGGGRPPKLEKSVEEDLIAENQRLRAEVDYLKKLNALVSQEERQNKRRG